MTLQQLEYIIAVARLKHFAKAADYCEVTQPTLSAMVQKLEDELGIKIFDRRRQPIEPTQSGRGIIEQAKRVVAAARQLHAKAEEEKQSITGVFNIGVLPTIAPYLVPRFFPQLMKRHPEMDVRVTEMKTADMKKALRQGELDAGILARIDGLEEMTCEPLFFEQFFAYVAEGDALFANSSIRTADLAGEYLWLLDEGHCFSDQLVKFCGLKAARRSKRSYNLGSIETFMRIVESGKGVTFIPELATLQLTDCQKRLVRPFALPVPTREIVMMTAPGFVRHTLLSLLTEAIRNAVPQEMLKLRKTQQGI
ncbi:MAG: LysR family transcriptional regulator [Prevotella sp.]|nr:LysR family transcriptional regulator [Prevotella sp.]